MSLKKSIFRLVIMVLLLLSMHALTAEAPEIDPGDTLHPTGDHCSEYDESIRRV